MSLGWILNVRWMAALLAGASLLAALAGWRAAALLHRASEEQFQRGVVAGELKERDAWRTVQAASFREAQEHARVAQAKDIAAVKDYVATLAARKPKVEIVDRERVVYVQSDSGRALGLDIDGVRLVEANRRALDWPTSGSASAVPPAPGDVQLTPAGEELGRYDDKSGRR